MALITSGCAGQNITFGAGGFQEARGGVTPTTWTILQQDGPNHLALCCNAHPLAPNGRNHLGMCALPGSGGCGTGSFYVSHRKELLDYPVQRARSPRGKYGLPPSRMALFTPGLWFNGGVVAGAVRPQSAQQM